LPLNSELALLKLERVQKFIGSKEYFEHKQRRFRSGDNKDITQNEAFIISDSKMQNEFQVAFERSKGLYYKGQPTFVQILESFKSYLSKL